MASPQSHPLELEVARFLDRHAIGGTVLVGVSGGGDSVALLRAMHIVSANRDLRLHAVHVEHGIRGAASIEDARWVKSLCDGLQTESTIERFDVPERADADGRGLEEAARIVRYEVFTRLAEAHGASAVAVAHTRDDQAETVLHHILRGTGLAGLRGMPAVRTLRDGGESGAGGDEFPRLIRPLLWVSRAEVVSYLDGLGQTYRQDLTNASTAHTRNRLRHELLPHLRESYNPQVDVALVRLAEQTAGTFAAIEALALRVLEQCISQHSAGVVRLDLDQLSTWPRPIIRESLRILYRQQGWPLQRMSADHWDSLLQLVTGEITRVERSLPDGIVATVRGSLLMLERPV